MNKFYKLLSFVSGFIFILPFILITYSLSPFIGKQQAIQKTGKLLTKSTAFFMNLVIPGIRAPQEYSVFQKKLKQRFLCLGLLYNLHIEKETADTIEFRAKFCPVTAILRMFGLAGLCQYACAGDLIIAKSHKDVWDFHRAQTIGTGGQYCNHTYSKKPL